MRRGANDQPAANNRGRGHAHLFEAVFADDFEFAARLDHVSIAVLAEAEDLPVVSPRRRGERIRARRDALPAIDLRAGPGVATREPSSVERRVVKPIPEDERGVLTASNLLLLARADVVGEQAVEVPDVEAARFLWGQRPIAEDWPIA